MIISLILHLVKGGWGGSRCPEMICQQGGWQGGWGCAWHLEWTDEGVAAR